MSLQGLDRFTVEQELHLLDPGKINRYGVHDQESPSNYRTGADDGKRRESELLSGCIGGLLGNSGRSYFLAEINKGERTRRRRRGYREGGLFDGRSGGQ